MKSSFCMMSASSMEVSSTIRTFVSRHRRVAFSLLITLSATNLGLPAHSPAPMNLWMVHPPIATAAMPVGAVTATASALPPCFSRKSATKVCRTNDLPVPAAPWKNTFRPRRSAASTTNLCSAFIFVS